MQDDKKALGGQSLIGTMKVDPLRYPEGPRPGQSPITLLVHHRDGVDTVQLTPGHPYVIGRSSKASIFIPDHSLSRRHARFEVIEGDLWVQDLGSTNGTLVNGRQVEREVVQPGATVQLGGILVVPYALAVQQVQRWGLMDHARFMASLQRELVRCRAFLRPATLLMLRDQAAAEHPLTSWYPAVVELLRPVDQVALYAPDAIEVLLTELESEPALALAEKIVSRLADQGTRLRGGIATFPRTASSSEELVARVWEALSGATEEQPISAASRMGRPPAVSAEEEAAAPLVVNSAMKAIFRTIDRLADSEIPVLILGETGTGKEVIARAIHERSRRRQARMMGINCGALPEQLIESALFGHERGAFTGATSTSKGIFEAGNKGTIFLDEIGDLPLKAQTALLRVLETNRLTRVGSQREIEVDVRVVAATHRDLERMSEEGKFRADLLFRLNAMTLEVPPLRQRPDEILLLAQRFLEEARLRNGRRVARLDPAAAQQLRAYPWPGNVRELRNVIERGVVICEGDAIGLSELPRSVRGEVAILRSPAAAGKTGDHAAEQLEGAERGRRSSAEERSPVSREGPQLDLRQLLRTFEQGLIAQAMLLEDQQRAAAASRLGLPLRTLAHKIRSLDIQEGDAPAGVLAEEVCATLARGESLSAALLRFERVLLVRALSEAAPNRAAQARYLGIPRTTLISKLEAHGLGPSEE